MSAPHYRWTRAAEEMLRALWAEGRSAREIALAIDPSGSLTVESIGAKRRSLGLAPRKSGMPSWPDEDSERLKSMWDDGMSASQIARALGVTRNAVIGKVHRLGLSRTKKPHAAVPRGPKLRVMPSPPSPPPPPPPPPPLVDPMRVRLVDLEFIHCRYPLWGSDGAALDRFLHCGLPKAPGSSYCPFHARLCARSSAPSERNAGPGIARAAGAESEAA